MDYFVKRGEQQFGPYTLAALQQYAAQGNISQQDLARSEAMTDWVPVASIIGNVPVPAATTFGAVDARAAALANFPLPPNLHWAIVLVLGIVTFGIFAIIWLFVEAAWIRRVKPQSRGLYYLTGYVAMAVIAGFVGRTTPEAVIIFNLIGVVLILIAVFSMRSDLEDCYEMVNPMGASLSGVMTFFFHVLYFQYWFREIREEATNSLAASATR